MLIINIISIRCNYRDCFTSYTCFYGNCNNMTRDIKSAEFSSVRNSKVGTNQTKLHPK